MVDFIEPEKEFHIQGKPLKLNGKKRPVMKFWQWCYSDLVQNITRGILGEYFVAWAIGVDTKPSRSMDCL